MKRMRKSLLTFLMAAVSAVLLFAAVACGDEEQPSGTFTFDKQELQLTVGEEAALTPQFSGFGDNTPSADDVTWRSSAPAVAQVEKGKVIAVSAGSATVSGTVTVAGVDYTANCAVTVAQEQAPPAAVVTVTLDQTALSLTVGDNAVTLLPAVTVDGVQQSAPEIVWSSSKEDVATVSGGTVTAVGAGEAIIAAVFTHGGSDYRAECTVMVEAKPVYALTLDERSATKKAGEELILTPSVTVNGEPFADAPAIEWSSSAEAVATVSGGTVTCIEGGVATITASVTIEGVTCLAACDVTVKNTYVVTKFAPKDAAFGALYALDGSNSVDLSALLGELDISITRNGAALELSKVTAVLSTKSTIFSVNAQGTGIALSGTGTGSLNISLTDVNAENTTVCTAQLPVTVCDQIIKTAQDWAAISGDKYYALGDNLTFDAYTLGAAGKGVTLTGTLDGRGYSVTAAFAASDYNNSGLFNIINGGTVKNLSVTAQFGEVGGIWQGTWNMYRCGALAVSAENAVIENCFVRTSYTQAVPSGDKNKGVAGVIGAADSAVSIRNTVVAVTALKGESNVVALGSQADSRYTLNNVLVYRSGGGISAQDATKVNASSNYAVFTGGIAQKLAEEARASLAAKAAESGWTIPAFVLKAFQEATLYENASVAADGESEQSVEAGKNITLTLNVTVLLDNFDFGSDNIAWESSNKQYATVLGGTPAAAGTAEGGETPYTVTATVTGVAVGEVTVTATVTLSEKQYAVSWTVVVTDTYDVTAFAFAEKSYALEEAASYTTSQLFTMNVTGTKNGTEYTEWAQFITFTSNSEHLIIDNGTGTITVQIVDSATATVTATLKAGSITETATVTVYLWTQFIDTVQEFIDLGAYQNGEIANWSGRYLVTRDLDFTGMMLTQLGKVLGTIDGGGHSLTGIRLAAAGRSGDTVIETDTWEGDDRFLFYIVSGTITNFKKINVTLGYTKAEQQELGLSSSTIANYSAGLCYQLDGTFSDSTLNVRFLSTDGQPTGSGNYMKGAVCVYAGWQSETKNCTINVGWMFTNWSTNGQYVTVNDRGFGYCYYAWGSTATAKLTNTKIYSTAYLQYASNASNLVTDDGCSISQNDSDLSSDKFEALFATESTAT